MNRWSVPPATWELMVKGSPLRSGYFWLLALFSGMAAFWTWVVTIRMRVGDLRVLAPILASLMLFLLIVALRAMLALFAARRGGTEALSLRAFAKMRTYFYCAALVTLGTQLLVMLGL